jgi:G protein beta subunit-like protein
MYQNHDSTTLLPCRVFKAHKDYLTRLLLSPDIKLLATCSADHTVRIWKIDMNEEHLEIIPEQQSPSQSHHQNGTTNTPVANAMKSENPHAPASSQSQFPLRPNTVEQDGSGAETSLNPKPFRSATSLASTASGTTSSPQSQFRANGAPGFGTDLISARRPLPCDVILDNHQRWVWDCAFSADSAYLVTVCSDHYARLWELCSATIIRQYNGHHRGAVCVALNDYSSPP